LHLLPLPSLRDGSRAEFRAVNCDDAREVVLLRFISSTGAGWIFGFRLRAAYQL